MPLTQQQVEELRQRYGITPANQIGRTAAPAPKKQGFFSEALDDIKETGSRVVDAFERGEEKVDAIEGAEQRGEQGRIRSLLQKFGARTGAISDAVGETVFGAAKTVLPQGAEDAVAETVEKVAAPVVQSEIIQDVVSRYQSLDETTKRDLDAMLGIGKLAADVVGLKGVGKAAGMAKRVAGEGVDAITGSLDDAGRSTSKLMSGVTRSPIAPKEAVGQVLQGGTDDIMEGIRAFKNLDTSGVKTYADLNQRIDTKIGELAQKVDAELSKDATRTLLQDLTATGKTKGGQAITSNYVESALDNLKELYETTGDAVRAAEIDELAELARTQGLTKLEVNDISRIYGQEFGRKAFSKMGDPLTSVNAQKFENIRRGLKATARQGIGGAEAKEADRIISSLYNTQRLVERNMEAVNKLRQRIQQRGLLEKAGNLAAKYADLLTGGTIRGLIGGLLPRGAGYKVMNALDLEEALERNLRVINEAIESGSDAEIMKALETVSGSAARQTAQTPSSKAAKAADQPSREGGSTG